MLRAAMATETEWSAVDRILARQESVSGDVHRYGLPCSDLKVALDGVQLKSGFALGAGSRSGPWATPR